MRALTLGLSLKTRGSAVLLLRVGASQDVRGFSEGQKKEKLLGERVSSKPAMCTTQEELLADGLG